MEPIARLFARDRLIRPLHAFVQSNFLHKLGSVKVLDVGCGNGFILREMITLGLKPENCTGIDLDEALINEAKYNSPSNMNYYCHRLEDMPDNGVKYDIVITSGFFAYFDNNAIKLISSQLKKMCATGCIMVSSNYDLTWQKMDNGQLRSLDLAKDAIRAFDFANNELNKLLETDFIHLVRFPHIVGGHQLSQLRDILQQPSRYSSYESMLDSFEIKATSHLDFYTVTK